MHPRAAQEDARARAVAEGKTLQKDKSEYGKGATKVVNPDTLEEEWLDADDSEDEFDGMPALVDVEGGGDIFTDADAAPAASSKRSAVVTEDDELPALDTAPSASSAPKTAEAAVAQDSGYSAAASFAGRRKGFVFTTGAQGVGYYTDGAAADDDDPEEEKENVGGNPKAAAVDMSLCAARKVEASIPPPAAAVPLAAEDLDLDELD